MERGGGEVQRSIGPVLAHRAVGELAPPERVAEHGVVHVAVALPETAGAVVVELVADIDVADVGAGPTTSARGRNLDLVVEQIDLIVDPVGLVAADARDTIAPPVALHQLGVAEDAHRDVGELFADRPVRRRQVLTNFVEVDHLVLRRLVAVRRGDATHQRVRPVLVAGGAQVVATDRDRHERAGTGAGNACGAHLGGNLPDDRARAGNDDRIGVEEFGEAWAGRLVEFALAGARSESGGTVERVRLWSLVVVVGGVAMDAASGAERVAERHHTFDRCEWENRRCFRTSGHRGADAAHTDRADCRCRRDK